MSDLNVKNAHVARAIEIFGSQEALAKAINHSQQYISWVLRGAGKVSAEAAILIETATGGNVTRQQLRPDLCWSPATSEASH